MIFKKEIKNNKTITYRAFRNISEFIDYIEKSPVNSMFSKSQRSRTISPERTEHTGTETYEEAMDLLLYGWEYGSKSLVKELEKHSPTKTKRKQCYSVQGHTACVPRYLQGLPDNMIATKIVNTKQKVIVLNKEIGYAADVKKETILQESAKVLKWIQDIESSGIRAEVNVVMRITDYRGNEHNILKICVKKPTQRMNLKQMSFPLLHPSMLRRICFSYIERMPELNKYPYYKTYGSAKSITKEEEAFFKGEYVIPGITDKNDLETYRIKDR